jgi:hypothetical protein
VKESYRTFAESIRQSADPNITTVIVTKRRHTKFYPYNVSNANDTTRRTNCQPGTCVDSGVTHPNFFEFYLQSHHPLQGTARPARYFVLENGMGLTEQQLQEFTYELCYSYVCATLPVGYAPPAYYADRLCERARCYFAHLLKSQDPVDDDNSVSDVGNRARSEVAEHAGRTQPTVEFDKFMQQITDMFPRISENHVRKLVTDPTDSLELSLQIHGSIVNQILEEMGPPMGQIEVGVHALPEFSEAKRAGLYDIHVQKIKERLGLGDQRKKGPLEMQTKDAPSATENNEVTQSIAPTGRWKDRRDIPSNPHGPWHPNLSESMFWM